MKVSALITDCEGLVLTADEIDFLRQVNPWGIILFQRNCEDREQIKTLISSFRSIVGREDAPVLIDQEGGRVQRLKPPHWRQYPTAQQIGMLYEKNPDQGIEAVRLITRLIAEDLYELGITVDCLPVLDVPQPDADGVIGDRAYSNDPATISILAKAAAEALLKGGVLPVIKHIPGHGRAKADSHVELPFVDTDAGLLGRVDFEPFRRLRNFPIAMTAHVVYDAFDSNLPATQSPIIVHDVIRSTIGFDGLLLSDDLSMNALSGSFEERTTNTFAAGCDIALHCNGNLDERRVVAQNVPALEGDALSRAQGALKYLNYPQHYDRERAITLVSALMENSV